MRPLVSILIPAYNVQDFVAETIQSAVNQTWPRKEVIVVDDGSRDATLSIARRFASREVCVLTQPNQGAAAARNHAFSLCQGDYMQWLDADDVLTRDKIARQMADIERASDIRPLLSCAWGRFMHRPSRASFVTTPLWEDLSPVDWLVRKLALNVYMQTATWLVSRELTDAAGPWDTRLLSDDDGEYFCRVLLASTGTRFVRDARIFYRVTGPGGLSYIGRSDRKMEALFLSMQLHVRYLRSLEDSERTRAACVTYLQTGLSSFHPERPDIVEQARALAEGVGGSLTPPRVSRTYACVEKWCGWPFARRVQMLARGARFSMRQRWDRALGWIEGTAHDEALR
jgi:glycosyltransferase involved in cell wall biosynthesis